MFQFHIPFGRKKFFSWNLGEVRAPLPCPPSRTPMSPAENHEIATRDPACVVCRCWCVKCQRASRRRYSQSSAASTPRHSTHLSLHSRTRPVTWPSSRCPPPASCSRPPATWSAPRCPRSRRPRRPVSLSNECRYQTGRSRFLLERFFQSRNKSPSVVIVVGDCGQNVHFSSNGGKYEVHLSV